MYLTAGATFLGVLFGALSWWVFVCCVCFTWLWSFSDLLVCFVLCLCIWIVLFCVGLVSRCLRGFCLICLVVVGCRFMSCLYLLFEFRMYEFDYGNCF